MAQLVCENLSLGYSHIIADSINISVDNGAYVSIVGENGSGKSTFIKTILGLIPPLSGSVKKFGESGRIGYLPQQSRIINDFPVSAFEVVSSGCICVKNGLFIGRAEKKIVQANMEKLGIWSIRKKCFSDLSGGQKQRVLLARALCSASDMLVLDEPVSGLDPAITKELYELLLDLNHNDKMTIIMVSHDMKAALSYSTHILHIGSASSFFGTVNEYKSSSVGKAFLGLGGVFDE